MGLRTNNKIDWSNRDARKQYMRKYWSRYCPKRVEYQRTVNVKIAPTALDWHHDQVAEHERNGVIQFVAAKTH